MLLTTAQKEAGRKQVSLLTAILSENAAAATPLAVSVVLELVDVKRLSFRAAIFVGPTEYEVADAAGRVKLFNDVDSVMKAIGNTSAVPEVGPLEISVSNPQLLVPEEYVGSDPKGPAKKAKVKFDSAKLVADPALASATAALTAVVAYATGSPRQRAYYDAIFDQKKSLADQVAFIDSEIARLAAIIAA